MVDTPLGYNVPAVEAWLASHTDALAFPLKWTRLEGGHSNLTYRLDDAKGRTAVIRRPPMGELLPKAHDMAREWAVISALFPTKVPVPQPIAFCADATVTGAAFYVMGHIDGHPLYNSVDTRRYVPDGARASFAFAFFDALADLHSLDPDALGLGDLGKKEGYIARQVKTWYRSWMASIEPAKLDDPRAHTLMQYFLDHCPEQGPARVVHGDYGVHNCLVGPDGGLAAIVDWEISTLGDPLADLAYALNAWPDPADGVEPLPEAATSAPGFPPRSALAARYGERTGRDLSKLDFYVGFNRWKSAAIVHGVYARYMEGKKGTEGVDLEGLRQSIGRALTAAEQAVARL
jgi:aminoglycoside phosphotransferase (APT) family kinase protein